MPSLTTVYNQLQDANTTLEELAALLTTETRGVVDFNRQAQVIICILEKISKNTCQASNLLSQMALATVSIEHRLTKLDEMYAFSHPEAALSAMRDDRLRDEILRCCPPDPPEPICTYEPCPEPDLATIGGQVSKDSERATRQSEPAAVPRPAGARTPRKRGAASKSHN